MMRPYLLTSHLLASGCTERVSGWGFKVFVSPNMKTWIGRTHPLSGEDSVGETLYRNQETPPPHRGRGLGNSSELKANTTSTTASANTYTYNTYNTYAVHNVTTYTIINLAYRIIINTTTTIINSLACININLNPEPSTTP